MPDLSIVTRDYPDLAKNGTNVYESVVIISRRANQISKKMKDELAGKLADFAPMQDNLEEVFENREQIEISKHYERMPKATLIAIEEYTEQRLVAITKEHSPEEEL